MPCFSEQFFVPETVEEQARALLFIIELIGHFISYDNDAVEIYLTQNIKQRLESFFSSLKDTKKEDYPA